ncbi:MAG: SsrA-binding protein [Candidatus Yonathbacteria bacterium RIFCSPHIGHO2_01_FULL_51_10]|uniref:SsrA-binding protein n=1 Tax=Candidatus Yonathbacteria bacterium RIFCSPHIGHO2_01_FULL_51_10 TaxID=1802723 RepID=A0A1G2S6K3_9BACT|nr:MAG: SsrA-binding protein [Candidatus Yonathbacteria bacterium RIFCSPHIGHO2_01_FULL_51_10]
MALVENRKARFHFDLLENFEAGLELLGFEVKALRKGQGSLDGAHVIVRGGEAYLVGMHIPPFQEANTPKDYDTRRTRRLLLSKKEIIALGDAEGTKGLTVVPLSVYNKNSKLKLSVAIARGKTHGDKRESIKRREADREAQRALRGGA